MAMRQQLIRVGIYNRCSTEEEAQKNALAIQAQESREIAAKKQWIIAAQYIESESGTSTKNRTEYQRLLEDMEKDLFDIVMIKSIDRLMRSAKDWYLFLNRLTENNKRLYIYIDDKFYTPDDSLISGIKAILAEEFSRELSKKIKNSHNRRHELHKQNKQAGLNITRPMFGWDKIAKDVYEINEREAEVYREAFEMAKSGKGFYTIANIMYDRGIRGKTGNKISNVQWQKMIYSPRAHGTLVVHKREYVFETHKFVDVPPEEWIYIDNALPAIVSKEYQDEVLQAISERRVTCKFGEYRRDMSKVGLYDLSGKIFCSECGCVYYRTSYGSAGERLIEWKCSTALTVGRKATNAKGCDNINLIDTEIHKLIEQACMKQYESVFGMQQNIIDEALEAVKKALQSDTSEKELCRLKKEYDSLLRKKNVLFDKLMSETIDDDEFAQYNRKLEEQIAPLISKIRDLEDKTSTYADYEERLAKIRESLKDGGVINEAKTQELIMIIDKIIVYPSHKVVIIFDKVKLLGMLQIYASDLLDEEVDERFFQITAEYVHTNMFKERRKVINKKIVDLFKENPSLMAKNLPAILGVGVSYVNTSIQELKKAGKLEYKGKLWIVIE